MWQTRMRSPSASTSASQGSSSLPERKVGVAQHGSDGRERAQPREDVERADVAGVDDALRAREHQVEPVVVVAVRVADDADEGRAVRCGSHAGRIQAVTDG